MLKYTHLWKIILLLFACSACVAPPFRNEGTGFDHYFWSGEGKDLFFIFKNTSPEKWRFVGLHYSVVDKKLRSLFEIDRSQSESVAFKALSAPAFQWIDARETQVRFSIANWIYTYSLSSQKQPARQANPFPNTLFEKTCMGDSFAIGHQYPKSETATLTNTWKPTLIWGNLQTGVQTPLRLLSSPSSTIEHMTCSANKQYAYYQMHDATPHAAPKVQWGIAQLELSSGILREQWVPQELSAEMNWHIPHPFQRVRVKSEQFQLCCFQTPGNESVWTFELDYIHREVRKTQQKVDSNSAFIPSPGNDQLGLIIEQGKSLSIGSLEEQGSRQHIAHIQQHFPRGLSLKPLSQNEE